MKYLIFLIILVFISCTENKPQTDSGTQDNYATEIDSISDVDSSLDETTDSDQTVCDTDTDSYSVKADDDNTEDKDIIPDEISETDTEEWPDYDYPAGTEGDPDCPSLLNAGFPYVDKDGKKHFCRKCDLPAPENDPQCIRNLWEMKNRDIMEEWPDYYCYPLPCDVTDKAVENTGPAYVSPCDIDAVSGTWHQSTGVFRQADIFEGKIGMFASADKKVDDKYIVRGSLLYEIKPEKYTLVSNSGDLMAYNHDRFLFIAGNSIDLQVYVVSAKKVENGWKYEFAYTDEWNRTRFIYPPAIGKNYVLINVENADGNGEREILYANVNDWNFKKLGTGTILYPQIFDDTAFFTFNNKVYACDLTKNPSNIETDCVKITREGELSVSFAVNKQDHKKVVYTDRNSAHQLNIADLTGSEIVYSKLELEMTPDLINLIPSQWDGDIFVLEEMYVYSEVQDDFRICYYSFSKDRKVCFPNPDGTDSRIRSIYGGVEGKYIIWKTASGTTLRDMECFCKEYPEDCLYDEFIPDEVPDDDTSPVFVY